MRLKEREIENIKNIIENIFGKNTKIYLFESGLDSNIKGRDIDLYIISKEPSFEKKIKALSKLKRVLKKPVDIILHKNFDREIEKEGLKGVLL